MNKRSWLNPLLLFILFFVSSAANAQMKDLFIKGTVMLQNGQTLQGYIKDNGLARMNYKILFKADEKDKKATLYDTTLVKTVTLEDGEIFHLLRFKGDLMTDSASVLGRLVIGGKASLYELSYNGELCYIVTNGGRTYMLQNDELEQGAAQVTSYHYKKYLVDATADSYASVAKANDVSFTDKDIAAFVKEYNQSVNVTSDVIQIHKKGPGSFMIVNGGGMIRNSDENEVYFQGMYRTYFSKVTRGLSLNIGLSYFNYNALLSPSESVSMVSNNSQITVITLPFQVKQNIQMSALPIQLQQNLLNKKVRPFIFLGADISSIKETDHNSKAKDVGGTIQYEDVTKTDFGVGMLFGAGIELDVYKGFMLKTEYRYENISHLILFGVGYCFTRK